MRNQRERLLDILEAPERIEKYAEEGKDIFERNILIHHYFGIDTDQFGLWWNMTCQN